MIALPNRGFPRIGQCSAHHTGAVVREELPALGDQVRDPRGRDSLRGWSPRLGP